MNKKLYVLTEDGWNSGYGSLVYLVGVFEDIKPVEELIKKNPDIKVTEIEVNKYFPLKKCKDFGDYTNDYFLGGYYE